MITVDPKQIERAELLLANIPNGAIKAITRAINRAVTGARTDAVRKVRERYYVRAKDVRETIRIYKASYSNPMAVVRSTGSPLALSKFYVRPSRPPKRRRTSPIIVRVARGQGGPLPGAFVAKMPSGHVGVFKRKGRSRLPIIQKFGPSVPQMLGHKSVVEYVEKKAIERLDKNLDHEISRLLKGAGRWV